MASRRDQLQSYQFLTQRVISAFVTRETDPPRSPLRRGIGAMFAGAMITIIVAAVVGIYGVFTGMGTDDWRVDGSVVLERETGATFVYFDGRLHPTWNLASAKLAGGLPFPTVHSIRTSALAQVDRGVLVGIPGAPDSLPTPEHQVGLPWTLCTGPDGAVTLLVAGEVTGGQPLAEAAVLVADPEAGEVHLVWQGHRHRLSDANIVVPALFGAMVSPAPAGPAWLNALPAGTDLAAARVPGRGEPSSAVSGRDNGELLVAQTGAGDQSYLVLDDGLAAITPMQAAIEAAYSPAGATAITIAEANSAPRSEQLDPTGAQVAPPAVPPALAAPAGDDRLCLTTMDAATPPEITVGGSADALAAAGPTMGVTTEGVVLANRVHMPPGKVAVVRALTGPDAATGTYHLVTDLGLRYPVPSPEALALLGYDAATAVDVPADLVTRIPAGPLLDPAAAILPQAG